MQLLNVIQYSLDDTKDVEIVESVSRRIQGGKQMGLAEGN